MAIIQLLLYYMVLENLNFHYVLNGQFEQKKDYRKIILIPRSFSIFAILAKQRLDVYGLHFYIHLCKNVLYN